MTCLMHCHLQLNVINMQTIRLFIDTVNHLSSKIAMSLDRLTTWSSQCNLALNPKKTEVRLLSTAQLSRVHGLDTHSINFGANEKELERVSTFRLLDTQVQGRRYWGWVGGLSRPPKIFKNRENSGKLRENSVTSGNICGSNKIRAIL